MASPQDVLPAPLRGLVPPMMTPLLDRDRLDVEGLEKLIEHMLAGGIDGLFVLGTSGEAAGLSGRLRRELIQRTCRQVGDRVPVLVGVTDTSFVDSEELARYAAGCGAHAAVVSAPYYLPIEQPELIRYVKLIAEEQPLPVMLYNIPFLTKTAYTPETVQQLVEIPRVIGMKDSSGDLPYLYRLQELTRHRADWSLLVGSELLMAEAVQRGIHGCVGGGANIYPQLMVNLYHAAVQKDEPRVAELQTQMVLMDKIYRIGCDVPGIIRGIKCALNCMGICSERMTEPFLPFSVDERKQVRQLLKRLGLLSPENNAERPSSTLQLEVHHGNPPRAQRTV